MLPAAHRLTDSAAFGSTTRRGRRASARTLGVYLAGPDEGADRGPARVGFVVSRAVGPAHVRNRVKRRLRHAARDLLDTLPAGSLLVVRAHPAAGRAGYARLAADLARCVTQVTADGVGARS